MLGLGNSRVKAVHLCELCRGQDVPVTSLCCVSVKKGTFVVCVPLSDVRDVLRLIDTAGSLPVVQATGRFLCSSIIANDAERLPDNLLFHGDNHLALCALRTPAWQQYLQERGGIKLVYMDPPFAVGTDFSRQTVLQDKDGNLVTFQAVAYSDKWGAGEDSFYAMLYTRLRLVQELLAEDGTCYVHCDWRTSALTRLLLDAVFGPERFLGEIIWHYTGGGRAKRYFSRKHDTIFHYAKSDKWTFNIDAVRVPYKPSSGYAKSGIVSRAGKRYAPSPLGTPVDDVWDIPIVNPMAAERLDYPTQKPEKLLERIIAASSDPGDLVADFFCGSGTTLAVAAQMGRRWLGADSGAFAVHTARERLAALMCGNGIFSAAENEFAVLQEHETAQSVIVQGVSAVASCLATPEGKRVRLEGVPFREVIAGTFTLGKRPCSASAWHVTSCGEQVRFVASSGPEDVSFEVPWQTLIASWSVSVPCRYADERLQDALPEASGGLRRLWGGVRAKETIILESPVLPEVSKDCPLWVEVTDIFGNQYKGVVAW